MAFDGRGNLYVTEVLQQVQPERECDGLKSVYRWSRTFHKIIHVMLTKYLPSFRDHRANLLANPLAKSQLARSAITRVSADTPNRTAKNGVVQKRRSHPQ